MQTTKQVDEEVSRLKALRSQIPPTTFFGGNNLAQLDAEIAVLERDLDEDDINSIYKDQDINSRAYDVIQWRYGYSDEAPSTGWQQLVDSKAKKK